MNHSCSIYTFTEKKHVRVYIQVYKENTSICVSNIYTYVHSNKQEAQLMLTTGVMHLAVSRGQQTWYHFGSVATLR